MHFRFYRWIYLSHENFSRAINNDYSSLSSSKKRKTSLWSLCVCIRIYQAWKSTDERKLRKLRYNNFCVFSFATFSVFIAEFEQRNFHRRQEWRSVSVQGVFRQEKEIMPCGDETRAEASTRRVSGRATADILQLNKIESANRWFIVSYYGWNVSQLNASCTVAAATRRWKNERMRRKEKRNIQRLIAARRILLWHAVAE